MTDEFGYAHVPAKGMPSAVPNHRRISAEQRGMSDNEPEEEQRDDPEREEPENEQTEEKKAPDQAVAGITDVNVPVN
eukprot:g46488.t1